MIFSYELTELLIFSVYKCRNCLSKNDFQLPYQYIKVRRRDNYLGLSGIRGNEEAGHNSKLGYVTWNNDLSSHSE